MESPEGVLTCTPPKDSKKTKYSELMFMRKHKQLIESVGRHKAGSELKEEQMKSQQRIQEKQKKVQELKQAVNTIKVSSEQRQSCS
ncbi:hypothetical protein PGIGA_G00195100 [Pangasianodon gigas]|uniref:Uncharacterized protein n=1 Tax=Pangasianodon gigas TaxID=30993 RepID=A0ACC5XWV0_PANGG|nr:hypothetical protein [Pangasianodon gigas]